MEQALGAEYRVVVLIGGLTARRPFTEIVTTTNAEDLEELPSKIDAAIEQYEFDHEEEMGVSDEDQDAD